MKDRVIVKFLGADLPPGLFKGKARLGKLGLPLFEGGRSYHSNSWLHFTLYFRVDKERGKIEKVKRLAYVPAIRGVEILSFAIDSAENELKPVPKEGKNISPVFPGECGVPENPLLFDRYYFSEPIGCLLATYERIASLAFSSLPDGKYIVVVWQDGIKIYNILYSADVYIVLEPSPVISQSNFEIYRVKNMLYATEDGLIDIDEEDLDMRMHDELSETIEDERRPLVLGNHLVTSRYYLDVATEQTDDPRLAIFHTHGEKIAIIHPVHGHLEMKLPAGFYVAYHRPRMDGD